MKVTTLGATMVRPSGETPTGVLWNSNVDLVIPRIHVASVYFFRSDGSPDFFDGDRMREALAKALVPFYPMAARLQIAEDGRVEINCNGAGVLYVEAEAEATIEDFGVFAPQPGMVQLVPAVEETEDITSYPLVLLQTTRLRCGGVAFGVGMQHHVADGMSGIHFINTIADMAKGVGLKVPPFIDRTLLRARNPPSPMFPHVEYQDAPTLISETLGGVLKNSVCNGVSHSATDGYYDYAGNGGAKVDAAGDNPDESHRSVNVDTGFYVSHDQRLGNGYQTANSDELGFTHAIGPDNGMRTNGGPGREHSHDAVAEPVHPTFGAASGDAKECFRASKLASFKWLASSMWPRIPGFGWLASNGVASAPQDIAGVPALNGTPNCVSEVAEAAKADYAARFTRNGEREDGVLISTGSLAGVNGEGGYANGTHKTLVQASNGLSSDMNGNHEHYNGLNQYGDVPMCNCIGGNHDSVRMSASKCIHGHSLSTPSNGKYCTGLLTERSVDKNARNGVGENGVHGKYHPSQVAVLDYINDENHHQVEVLKVNGSTNGINGEYGKGNLLSTFVDEKADFSSSHGAEIAQREQEEEPVDVQVFKFTREQLATLKSKALESGNKVPYSTYEMLSSHIWKCFTMARCLSGSQLTKLYIATDGRSRMVPRLPEGYFGNVIFTATPITTAAELLDNPTYFGASKIHESVARMDNEYLRSALDYLELQPDLGALVRGGHSFKSPNLGITSWARLPLYDADFGWGRPIFMGPAKIAYDGLVYVLPSPTSDGSLTLSLALRADYMTKFTKLIYAL